ncbi:protein of unknown function DUF159 [Chloroherpeton thalassium ATCC 35110]|uniref:Abasic site processing protein n=1 Tax=Chloroherpeton thalassium (strain ATCC 35110 / GB-78) TaxID=517418 RepID=B3QZA7_CHLT3|nr:protein of unknown function DUF159 [Chloroherpeton thalassium ATCC 35110]
MCGRFTQFSNPDELAELFSVREFAAFIPEPSYNLAPKQFLRAIVGHENRRLGALRWGLVPAWAKSEEIGQKLINARAETLAEKPSFREAFKKRRCMIPANGFYEWRKSAKGKVPMYIYQKSEKPFALAGLYEIWRTPAGESLGTCTIVTTEPNSLMASIHNRMPAILSPANIDSWLDRSISETAQLHQLLQPFPSEKMAAYKISSLVNSPKNNSEACFKPVSLSDASTEIS